MWVISMKSPSHHSWLMVLAVLADSLDQTLVRNTSKQTCACVRVTDCRLECRLGRRRPHRTTSRHKRRHPCAGTHPSPPPPPIVTRSSYAFVMFVISPLSYRLCVVTASSLDSVGLQDRASRYRGQGSLNQSRFRDPKTYTTYRHTQYGMKQGDTS